MANGTYSVPRQFKDEDKWFWIFTKIQLLIVGIGAGIGLLFFLILAPFKLYIPAVIVTVFSLTISGLLAFLPMPASKYLYGGGVPLYVVAFRLVNKLFISKKILYVKNMPEDKTV